MDDDRDDDTKDPQERIDSARRRLLRNVVYVPPAIIGIVSLSQGCAPGSCVPTNCSPSTNCGPNQCRPRTSDARLKTDIAVIRGALDLLEAL